jgi:mannuronan 5-epimerase
MPHAPIRHRARRLVIGLLVPLVALAAACQPAPTDPPPVGSEVPAVDPADYGAVALGGTDYPVPADARWVAPDGENSAPGTAEQPWRTLGHAVLNAPGGSTVVLRAGTYRETVEVPATRRLTIQPAPGEVVWMSGSDVVADWTADGEDWVHADFASPFTSENLDPTLVTPTSPMAGDPDMVFVDGVPLAQVGSRSAVELGAFFATTSRGRS